MPQVFVSYARSTEPQAQQVTAALRSLGHEVWRDDELPAHRAYSEVIEERLQAAGAVVVIWSAEAVHRVGPGRGRCRAERGKGTLRRSSVDGTIPPMPSYQIQCADLQGWDGDASAPGWRKVQASVRRAIGEEASSAPVPTSTKHSQKLSVLRAAVPPT